MINRVDCYFSDVGWQTEDSRFVRKEFELEKRIDVRHPVSRPRHFALGTCGDIKTIWDTS